jgi:hypothetical protein
LASGRSSSMMSPGLIIGSVISPVTMFLIMCRPFLSVLQFGNLLVTHYQFKNSRSICLN